MATTGLEATSPTEADQSVLPFEAARAKSLPSSEPMQLDGWLEKVASSPLTALYPFVAGIYQDKAAVQAGLASPWSQGQTEGQITRLKLIKRQGYGRARFALLRQRVLHAA